MSNVKQEIQQVLDGLPEDATIEDMMYRLYVLTRLEQARKEAAEGNLIDQKEVEAMMSKWIIE